MYRTIMAFVLVFVMITISSFTGGQNSSYAMGSGSIILKINEKKHISEWFNNQGQLIVYSGIDQPLTIKAFSQDAPTKKYVSKKYSKTQLYCLARNIYFESRGEGDEGMRAVAYVTLNRAESTLFPSSICSVVYQGKRNKTGQLIKNRCQFSWACDGLDHTIKNKEMWDASKRIANEVARTYDNKTDPTFRALFYHASSISHKRPFKKMHVTATTQIGNHIFYRKSLA